MRIKCLAKTNTLDFPIPRISKQEEDSNSPVNIIDIQLPRHRHAYKALQFLFWVAMNICNVAQSAPPFDGWLRLGSGDDVKAMVTWMWEGQVALPRPLWLFWVSPKLSNNFLSDVDGMYGLPVGLNWAWIDQRAWNSTRIHVEVDCIGLGLIDGQLSTSWCWPFGSDTSKWATLLQGRPWVTL
jgi:hypothetical protein